MPEDRLALSRIPPTLPEEADYDAICKALMATPRGRLFLEEYTRRQRQADIAKMLAATERLESAATGTVAVEAPHAAPAVPQQGIAVAAERLRDMALRMRTYGVGLETSEQIEALAQTILSATFLHDPADHRAQKLSEVLQYLEFRIDQMLDNHMQGARGEAAEAPAVTVSEEEPAAEAALAAPDEAPVPDAPSAPVDSSPVSEPSPEITADTMVEIAQPAPDETMSAAPAAATTIEATAVAEDSPAPSFVELDFATFVRRIEPIAIVPDPESPAARAADAISEPFPIGPPEPAAVAVQTESESAELGAPAVSETAPPEVVHAVAGAPAADQSLLPSNADDDVVIVDTETLLPIELADQRAVVELVAEPPAQTDNAVEVTGAAVAAAATGETVATQVDEDLNALGTAFAPEAAAGQPPTVATKSAEPQDRQIVAEASQTVVNNAESASSTAIASGRELVPSMWEPPIVAQASHDDPADFLLEPLPSVTPSAPPQTVAATAASGADAPAPAAAAQPPADTGPTTRHATGGPLAALAAMSDEERIALFT